MSREREASFTRVSFQLQRLSKGEPGAGSVRMQRDSMLGIKGLSQCVGSCRHATWFPKGFS